mgnify:CR=1 FL=1
MVQGRDRRVELGYQLALECRKMIGMYPLKNKNSKYNPPPASLSGNLEEDAMMNEPSGQIAVTSSA